MRILKFSKLTCIVLFLCFFASLTFAQTFAPSRLDYWRMSGSPTNILTDDMVTADLNSDGKLDYIRANEDSVLVLMGADGLNFQMPVTYRNQNAFGTAKDIDFADINNDANPDIIVGMAGYADLVYFNLDNSGHLIQSDTLILPIDISFFGTTDLNGDAFPDMVIATTANEIHCYLGDGNNQFSASAAMPIPDLHIVSDLRFGHFNNDNFIDVAFGAISGIAPDSIIICYGNGNGGFSGKTGFPAGNGMPASIEIADFNEDGLSDIIAACPGANYMSSRISILYGEANGQLAAAQLFEWGNNERRVKVLDINEDNHADVLVSNPPFSEIIYLTGDGSGNFTQVAALNCPNFPQSFATSDVNADGFKDIIVSNPGALSFFLTNQSQFITEAEQLAGGNYPIETLTADFNQDNLTDIAVLSRDDSNCEIFLQDNNQNFNSVGSLSAGNKPSSMTKLDLNLDQNMDIVVSNRNSNNLSVFTGSGNGNFNTPIVINSGARPIGVIASQLNADNYPDLLVLNESGKSISILLNDQSGNFSSTELTLPGTPNMMTVNDFNNDSYADIAVSFDEFGYNIIIYLGNGQGQFPNSTELNTLWSYNIDVPLQSGDVNNDGNMDILYCEMGKIHCLLGSGDAQNFSSVSSMLPAGSFGINPFKIADLNGDALPDLAIPNLSSSGWLTLIGYGAGDGTFVLDPLAYECGSSPQHIHTGKLNDDDHFDLIVANSASDDVTLLMNSGATPQTHDVGIVSILAPPESGVPGEIFTPKVIIRNFGAAAEQFDVSVEIGTAYSKTQNVNLAVNQSDTLQFVNWTPQQAGSYQMTAQTLLSGDDNSSNDQAIRTIQITDTSSGATISVQSISPNTCGAGGVVSIEITGSGFQDGIDIQLSKSGELDLFIPPNFITVHSETRIEALLNIRNAAEGNWDVKLTNPDGSETTIFGGFTVEPLVEDLWINVIGRNPLQLGEETTITIWYGNNGNVDARDVWIGIAATDEPFFKLDMITAPQIFITLLDYHLAVMHSVLKPGESDHFDLILKFPIEAGSGNFDFEARISKFDDGDELFWVDHFFDANTGEPFPEFGYTFPKAFNVPCPAMATFSGWLKNFVSAEIASTSNIAEVTAETYVDNKKSEMLDMMKNEFVEVVEDGSGHKIKQYYDAAGNLLCYQEVTENYLDMSKMIWGRINSVDPNEKEGPAGNGEDNWVTADISFPYTIYFENADTATAPAHKVVIKDTLDPDLDWTTLQFLDYKHQPTAVDFDSTSGELIWTFDGIDLPPNVNPPEGESHFSYTLEQKKNLSSGTQITNRASIIFDYNYPIKTSTVLNTIDAVAPTSQMNALPAETNQPGIALSWSGSDDSNGSGIDRYILYVSEDGGPFLRKGTYNEQNAVYIGRHKHRYQFYIEAVDIAGNKEIKTVQAETGTTINAAHIIGVSPSPYVPARGHEIISFFGGDIANAKLSIFTRSGEKVIELTESNGNSELTWDAKNEAGNPCASGVYIWLLEPQNGSSETGKFAIIR